MWIWEVWEVTKVKDYEKLFKNKIKSLVKMKYKIKRIRMEIVFLGEMFFFEFMNN